MGSKLALYLLVPLSLALFASEAHPQDDFGAFEERFEGRWRLASSMEQAERVRDRAAEQAASAFNVFIRPIAGSRLRDGTSVSRGIELAFEEERRRIRVRFDESSYVSEVGETVRVRRADGTPMRLTQRFRDDGSLEQVFQTDSGTRWYVYRSTGADTMRVESTIDSERMPQPMHFALDYRRR